MNAANEGDVLGQSGYLQFCQQQYQISIRKMFSRLVRPLFRGFFTPKKVLAATTILAYSYFRTQKMLLDSVVVEETSSESIIADAEPVKLDLDEYIQKLQTLDVCEGKELLEGDSKVVTVKDHEGKQRKIMIRRLNGKLYSFAAACPHKEPFETDNSLSSLEDAVCFNDKLYCPHHGCIFDIKSGSVEHGPSLFNLPIFFSQERDGIVKLIYPSAIPSSVAPSLLERDVEDLRKVVILGGDDAATIGCINGLRQFGFQGEISVVKEGKFHYPFRKEYLHKSIVNLHLNDKPKQDKKQPAKTTSYKLRPGQQIDEIIRTQLQEKIYNKLAYYRKEWYEYYGIDFIFNEESYRIINKQYYPYITFSDGTKLEFDALLVATGVTQKVPTYQSITVNSDKDIRINLAQNVFCPLRSKEQHQKLLTFLNKNEVKSLLVLGYNVESLQFIEALNKEFPDIKVNVIDTEKDSAVSQYLGPDLEKAIAKEFTSRGVDFYIKIQDELIFSNRFSKKNKKKLEATNAFFSKVNIFDPKSNYQDSVQVRISDELRLKGDAVVIFPHAFAGNTQWVKNGKYTDFDFFHDDRISGDTFGRTDNIRIFAAGIGSANEYYLLNKRLVTSNHNVSMEQGYNVALNMEALRIPFSYVPFQAHSFFGKKLMYVGTRDFFDSVLLIGSLEDWDFITIYALGSKVKAVCATPSRSRHLSILRESFRVNCVPMFQDLVSGYWSIDNLERLVKQLKKSGCYRDLIFANRENIHKKDLIWMERSPDAGFENDRPLMSEEYPSVQVGENGVLKEL